MKMGAAAMHDPGTYWQNSCSIIASGPMMIGYEGQQAGTRRPDWIAGKDANRWFRNTPTQV